MKFFSRYFSTTLGILLSVLAGVLWLNPPCRPAAEGTGLEAVSQFSKLTKIILQNKEIAIHHAGEALDKPFFHPLCTPDRRCVTYDAPADHLHHRGLCVGWPDVSGTDFWAEVNSPPGRRGKMIPKSVDTRMLESGAVELREKDVWLTEPETELVQSEQVWTFWPPEGNLQLVDLDLRLTALEPEVVFGSDPNAPREYHGLTLRAGPFAEPRYFNSEGIEGGQNCKGKPAKWCALAGMQAGGPVLAAILDHPSNSSHPTRFYVQDQGMQFISSSPNYGKAKILKQGETWRLRYRVVAAGKPPEGRSWDLNELWNQWVKADKGE
ncbi:MAG: DUF6807 family protein [bacterium]